MNIFKNILAFSIGAAIGSVVTWKLLEKKYEQIAQEEIDSVKAEFRRASSSKNESKEPEPDVNPDYNKVLENLGYSKNGDSPVVNTKGGQIAVISPDAYGELDDYGEATLTYYADKVLAYDSDDSVVTNIAKLVGHEALESFGEYEDDFVHVRNDDLKMDFEISLDRRKFKDVVGSNSGFIDEDDYEK